MENYREVIILFFISLSLFVLSKLPHLYTQSLNSLFKPLGLSENFLNGFASALVSITSILALVLALAALAFILH